MIFKEIKLAISPKKGPSVKYIIANIQIRVCFLCLADHLIYHLRGLSDSSFLMHAVGGFIDFI